MVTQAIRNHREDRTIVTEVLNLLGFIYKLSYKVKIFVATLRAIWGEMRDSEDGRRQYFKWVNEFMSCEQGIGEYSELEEFECFVKELFPREQLRAMRVEEFMLAKNLILELNKKHRYIVLTHTIKEVEYKRKVEMEELKLYEYFMYLIYDVEAEDIYERGLEFFLEIYNGRENELADVDRLYQRVMGLLEEYSSKGQQAQIKKTLKLLNIIIDNSEKKGHLAIDSL